MEKGKVAVKRNFDDLAKWDTAGCNGYRDWGVGVGSGGLKQGPTLAAGCVLPVGAEMVFTRNVATAYRRARSGDEPAGCT